MKHATVIGGFITGEKMLEGVADSVYDLGLAQEVDVFTLIYAMKHPERIAKAVRDGLAIGYSAGVMAVRAGMRPSQLLACNGPEPRTARQLVSAAVDVRRNCKALIKGGGPLAGNYAAVIDDCIAQGRHHPLAYFGHILEISGFSTIAHLNASIDGGVHPAQLIATADELFPHSEELDYGNVPIHLHNGNHVTLLADPRTVLGVWAEAA